MKRIPLNVIGAEGLTYSAWPVTQGIPFADGELPHGTPVRVTDEDGAPVPTQARCLTTWDKDQAYVRWLLVDFQADLRGEPRRYFLEYGDDVAPVEHPSPITVEQAGDMLTLDTGELRLELLAPRWSRNRPEESDPILGCFVKAGDGWRDLFRGNPGPYLYMEDQDWGEYDSTWAGPAPRVSIEEQGPLRTSVCIRGHHAAPTGVRFCPYILRIHLFAGKSDLRIEHTFIFDQDPHAVELRRVEMRFPLNLGANLQAAIGGADVAHHADRWETVTFLQSSDREYSVTFDDRPHGAGTRTRGWAMLNGTRGAALAVVRNCWQEYPKGFELSRDGIAVRIWPEDYPETLAFTTPFEEDAIHFGHAVLGGTRDEEEVKRLLAERPTAPLNLKSFRVNTMADLAWVEDVLERNAPDRTATYNDTGTQNGVGAAKTTEIVLRLSPEPISEEDAEAFAAAAQEPLIAPAEAAYACATGAFGPFHHAGDERFAEVDAGLDDMLWRTAMDPLERGRLYGMMRYGNMVCSHAPGPTLAFLHYKDTDPDKAFRRVGPYNNEANDQIMAVWGNFLRTGRRDHYFLAQNYSRAVADVATIHAHPSRSDVVGLMHYHNAHVWSGGQSPSHTLLAGLLTDYYLSGSARVLEVARETADWVVRTQTPCGIVKCEGTLYREFTGPLWNLFEFYRATWEEQYGELARRSLNWLLRALPRPGRFPRSVYTRGERGDEAEVEDELHGFGACDVFHLYMYALRLFDSKTLREHIVAEADYIVWETLNDNFVTAEQAREMLTPRSKLWPVDDRFYWTQWAGHEKAGGHATSLCLAYEITGDLVYAAFAKDQVFGAWLRQAKRCRHYADWRFTWLQFGSTIPRLMRLVADAMDKDPEGLARAEAEWRRKRAETGRDVYDGPGVDLDADEMDPNGFIINRPPDETIALDIPIIGGQLPSHSIGVLSTEDHPKP